MPEFHRGPRGRGGATLAELCVVVAVMGTLFALGIPRMQRAADRAAARGAVQDAASLFSLARRSAISRRVVVGVVLDTAGGRIVARAGPVVVGERGLRAEYGVRLSATRDSMAYDPRGLGYGAANLTVVARRGAAAETLVVSRLGRVRR